MFYYAYLNEKDIVEAIYALPTKITDDRYILIPTNDQTLIGKRYNRLTGKFEDVVIFYYAVLSDKGIVMEVVSSETEITEPNKIKIPSNNTSLVGKWYNRQTAEFLDPPIHILAEHNTQQINILNQDKWLQAELDEINSKLLDLGNGSFGGYKCSFKIKDNQQTTSEWVTGKKYVFNFDTGIPGYFPRMIRLVNSYNGDDTLVAELFIAKNEDGSVKYAYLDKTYLGIAMSSTDTAATRRMEHNVDASEDEPLHAGRQSNGNRYDEGGSAFFQAINTNGSRVRIGNFNYTENTLSFTMRISSGLVGNYTVMNLKGYVF